jgi:signal transduction histidine kinase
MRLPGFGRRQQRAASGGSGSGRQPRPDNSGPSVQTLTVRVAMAAAGIVGAAYLIIAVVVAVVAMNRLTDDIDRELAQALEPIPVQVGADQPFGRGGPDRPFGPPVAMWRISQDGTVQSQNNSGIALPAEYQHVERPVTVTIGGVSVRIEGAARGSDYVVVGESMDAVNQTEGTLIAAELGIGCTLLICVFLGALAVGRRVALPIERARVRQLEFTADASHELRTPLSVIEAQTSLARARAREPEWDAHAFERIDTELRRTRRLVDDMLWLARFDSMGGRPESEPVDVGVLAAQTADRFSAMAESRNQKLSVSTSGGDGIVMAPPDWLDRLVGVLLDNALKYSPEGGSVAVSVAVEGRRVRLTVDDSGPGISEPERGRVFDRFHRATNSIGGAGLGLAIADAVARATGGHWSIGTSPAGGASVSVGWPRHGLAS